MPKKNLADWRQGMAKPVEKAVDSNARRARSVQRRIPALVMSKYYPGKTVEETTGIGANDYMPPPTQAEKARRETRNIRRRRRNPTLENQLGEAGNFVRRRLGPFRRRARRHSCVVAGVIGVAMKPNILAAAAAGELRRRYCSSPCCASAPGRTKTPKTRFSCSR